MKITYNDAVNQKIADLIDRDAINMDLGTAITIPVSEGIVFDDYETLRKNALEHLVAAEKNGFTSYITGCNVIIGDGLKGTDDFPVPVVGGEYVKEAKIGHAIMDADVFISLTHFKGHESTGFGGALKNIGMGCGSRGGKMEQHNQGKPMVVEKKCIGCKKCLVPCPQWTFRIPTEMENISELVARTEATYIKKGGVIR